LDALTTYPIFFSLTLLEPVVAKVEHFKVLVISATFIYDLLFSRHVDYELDESFKLLINAPEVLDKCLPVFIARVLF